MTLDNQLQHTAVQLAISLNELINIRNRALAQIAEFNNILKTSNHINKKQTQEQLAECSLTYKQIKNIVNIQRRIDSIGSIDRKVGEMLGIIDPQVRQKHPNKTPKQSTIPAHIANLVLALNKLDPDTMPEVDRAIIAGMLKPIDKIRAELVRDNDPFNGKGRLD